MKYILLFILIYWIGKRVLRIFSAVQGDDGNDQRQQNTSNSAASPSKSVKGEYVDFEEIE